MIFTPVAAFVHFEAVGLHSLLFVLHFAYKVISLGESKIESDVFLLAAAEPAVVYHPTNLYPDLTGVGKAPYVYV